MDIKQSRRYRPLPISQPVEPYALAQWVAREFQRVADALDSVLDIEQNTSGPSKPQDGMLRYADGTYWNPDAVSGEGFYGYWDGAWNFLGGSGGGGSVSYGSALGLANANADGSLATVSRSDHQHKRDVRVFDSGGEVATRNSLSFLDGTGLEGSWVEGDIQWTITDNSGDDTIEVQGAAQVPVAASASDLDNASAAGTSDELARGDHTHKRDIRVAKAGADVGTRNRLNLIEGSNVTLTVTDDSGNDEVDVTIAAAGATGKHSIWVPATAMVTRTTLGANIGLAQTSNYVMLATLDFSTSQDEFAQFTVRMPKSWDESTVTARFVWSHAATTTNFGVVWGLQGTAFGDSDALNVAFSGGQTVADTGGTTDDCFISDETSTITIAGTPAEGDFVVFQVYRDHDAASDTMAIDARLHGVLLVYNTNAATDD